MPVYGGIDIGSNTVQMLTAMAGPDGLSQHNSQLRTTRLGANANQNYLLPEAIRNTAEAVAVFFEQIRQSQAERSRIIATSAVRDAKNQDALLAAIRKAAPEAPPVEVFSGQEEAYTSFLGVRASLPDPPDWPVVDLGGSSMELIYEAGETLHSVSGDIGAVRAHVNGWIREKIQEKVQITYPKNASADGLIGVGGTVTTAAGVLAGLSVYDRAAISGMLLTDRQLESLLEHLLPMTVQERCGYSPLLERRGEIIVEGLEILLALLDDLDIHQLMVCGGGILDGVIWQMATGQK